MSIKTLTWVKPLWLFCLLGDLGIRPKFLGHLYRKGRYYDRYFNPNTNKHYLLELDTGHIANVTFKEDKWASSSSSMEH